MVSFLEKGVIIFLLLLALPTFTIQRVSLC